MLSRSFIAGAHPSFCFTRVLSLERRESARLSSPVRSLRKSAGTSLALQPHHRDMRGGAVRIDTRTISVDHVNDSTMLPDLRPVVEHGIRIRHTVAFRHGIAATSGLNPVRDRPQPGCVDGLLDRPHDGSALTEVVRIRDENAAFGNAQHLRYGSRGLGDVMQSGKFTHQIE